MKLSVKFRPKATRDVLDEMLYLEEQANKQTALRFYDAVKTTCGLIAERPLIGKRMQLQIGLGEEVRWLAAGGAFSKFLVFYQVTQSGIDVVRVLHGSRNIRALLDAEPDE